MGIKYLQIRRPYSFASPFNGLEFVVLIYAANENITSKEQEILSDQIVDSGCRYAVCAGYKSSSWDDSIDWAYIRRNKEEALDRKFVMTSWHDDESLEDIVFFFLNNTSFDSFTADRFVVLLVGGDESVLSGIQSEIEKQLGARRKQIAEYRALFAEEVVIFIDLDPTGSRIGGKNANEYELEARTFLPRLRSCSSVDEVRRVLYEEFVRWFGPENAGAETCYQEPAGRIWSAWRRRSQAGKSS